MRLGIIDLNFCLQAKQMVKTPSRTFFINISVDGRTFSGCKQEYIKENVVLCIAVCKHSLKSTEVKLTISTSVSITVMVTASRCVTTVPPLQCWATWGGCSSGYQARRLWVGKCVQYCTSWPQYPSKSVCTWQYRVRQSFLLPYLLLMQVIIAWTALLLGTHKPPVSWKYSKLYLQNLLFVSLPLNASETNYWPTLHL